MCARITFGAIVSEARGSLLDITYSRNRGGAYARAKASPTQSLSSYANLQRDFFSDATAAFNALSDSEYKSWLQFFDKNNTASMSSKRPFKSVKDLYIACQINSYRTDLFGTVYPPYEIEQSIKNFAISKASSSSFHLSMTVSGNPIAVLAFLYMSRPVSAARRSPNSDTQYFINYYSGYDAGINFSTSIYRTRFGLVSIPSGSRIHWSAKLIAPAAAPEDFDHPCGFNLGITFRGSLIW